MTTYGEVIFTRHSDGFEVDRADDNTLIAHDVMDQLPAGPMDIMMRTDQKCSLATCGLNHPGTKCYSTALVRITSRHGETYDYRIGLFIPDQNAWEAYKVVQELPVIEHVSNPIFEEQEPPPSDWIG